MHRHQTSNGAQLQVLRVGPHPTDMIWRDRSGEEGDEVNWKARIFVAAANTNNVFAVAVSDLGEVRMAETINVSATPLHPLGMTPSALALSDDRKKLYVVCSDANAVAAVDVRGGGSPLLGFIPTRPGPTPPHAPGA